MDDIEFDPKGSWLRVALKIQGPAADWNIRLRSGEQPKRAWTGESDDSTPDSAVISLDAIPSDANIAVTLVFYGPNTKKAYSIDCELYQGDTLLKALPRQTGEVEKWSPEIVKFGFGLKKKAVP